MKAFATVLLACVLLTTGCGGGGGGGGGHGGGGPPPGAVLASLSPSSVTAGGPPFTLTVTGSNFVAGGSLSWNGVGLGPYQLVSPTEITILVAGTEIPSPGTASIVVRSPNVTDSNPLTLTIDPLTQSACVLFGSYNFFFTGFNSNGPVTIAGDFGVDAAGHVIGEQDFKDLKRAAVAEPITGGSCTNAATANEGTLTLATAAGTYSYAFAGQTKPAPGVKGRLAMAGGQNSLSGGGRFNFAKGGYFTGDFVLGVVGSTAGGARMAVVGRFTDTTPGFSTPGTLSNGLGDINTAGVLATSVPITGSVGVPDAFWRSAATLTIGTQTLQMAFYVLNPQVAFVANADPAAGSPLLAGFVNSQAAYGQYNTGNLSAPIIVSSWGAVPGGPPASSTALVRAANFNAGAGSFDLVLDEVTAGVPQLNQGVSGASYTVAGSGRGTVSFTAGGARSYVLYLDDFNDGYVLDASPNVGFGFFSAQAAGPYDNASISGSYAAGTWFGPVPTAPNAAGVVSFNAGAVSGLVSGSYALDASGVGRGTATVNPAVFGGADLVFYVVAPNAIELMSSDPVSGDGIAFLNK